MGTASVTKRVVSYCQKEQGNTVLPKHQIVSYQSEFLMVDTY